MSEVTRGEQLWDEPRSVPDSRGESDDDFGCGERGGERGEDGVGVDEDESQAEESVIYEKGEPVALMDGFEHEAIIREEGVQG